MNRSKWYISFILILGIFLYIGSITITKAGVNKNNTTKTSIKIDKIALKQLEMRDTTVSVRTRIGSGSGIIINCFTTDIDETFEYIVLTNAHITNSRFMIILLKVNSLTGVIETKKIDTGCNITAFDHTNLNLFHYDAVVIAEDKQYDFALLSFRAQYKFAVAKIADEDMLNKVRVFDEVFAIGCQLGRGPIPTTGIISQIITGKNNEKEWTIYGNTAQITPGSSGGGLFKKYDEHYYMIGIPFRVVVAGNGQIIPHLARAISVGVAKDFINQNMVSRQ
jgi:S1-C subfamily serine protease